MSTAAPVWLKVVLAVLCAAVAVSYVFNAADHDVVPYGLAAISLGVMSAVVGLQAWRSRGSRHGADR